MRDAEDFLASVSVNIAGQAVANIVPRPQVQMFADVFPDSSGFFTATFVEEEEKIVHPDDEINIRTRNMVQAEVLVGARETGIDEDSVSFLVEKASSLRGTREGLLGKVERGAVLVDGRVVAERRDVQLLSLKAGGSVTYMGGSISAHRKAVDTSPCLISQSSLQAIARSKRSVDGEAPAPALGLFLESRF